MPDLPAGAYPAPGGVLDAKPALMTQPPLALQYVVSLLLVAVATAVALAVQRLISAPNLTLIFVLPVIIAASLFGLGPSLLAVVLSALVYDFFFTAPYYSLAIDNPAEIAAVVLLLVIATIVASVSATSRRRAVDAIVAAERAEALHAVAHAVMRAEPQREVLQAAAAALHRIFRAPAVVFVQRGGDVELAATAGAARSGEKDREAARGALSSQIKTRGESYPYVETYFDFWPVAIPIGDPCVLGVDFRHAARERPVASDALVESVAAYVAAVLARDGQAQPPRA